MPLATRFTNHGTGPRFDPETAPRVPRTRQVADPEPAPREFPGRSRAAFFLGVCGNALAGALLLLMLMSLPGVIAMLAGIH